MKSSNSSINTIGSSKSKSIGSRLGADDDDDKDGFNVVKAAKKLLKKRLPDQPMELGELARALQKQQQKQLRKGSKEDASASAAKNDLVTPSKLRAALEAAGGKFEFGSDDGGSAVTVQLRDSDSSSKKKRKSKVDDGKKDEKKKKRQRSSSSEGRSAAATPSEQASSVAVWRKSHKVVVMVEPTPDGAAKPSNPVREPHLVPAQAFQDLSTNVKEPSWKVPLQALVEKLSQQFERPSPIQAQAWPILMSRHNLVGIAETGR